MQICPTNKVMDESRKLSFDSLLKDLNPPSKNKEKLKQLNQLTVSKGKEIRFFSTKQVKAAKYLIQKLRISSEDTLKTFPIDSFVKMLVNLIDDTKDDRMLRILAFQALVTLFRVLPSSCDALVKFDGLTSFLDVLTTINATADQSEREEDVQMFLEALEKISKKHPMVCLKAGILEAMLPFYNSSIDLKVAHSIVMNMNMYKEVTAAAAAKFLTIAVPFLLNFLKEDCDVKVVELASVCLSEIMKGFESSSNSVDEIICSHEFIEEISRLISPGVSRGGQASLNTSAWMALVFLLETCAKNSHLGSKAFTEIIVTVKDLLTGAGVHPASSRPVQQIFAIVNVANELLPPVRVKQDDSIGTEISARVNLLEVQPQLLQHFGLDLLPLLFQICEDGVSASVPRECLLIIAKLVYFSSTSTIESFMIWERTSSFLAGVLSWTDPVVLSRARWIAKILLERLPDMSSEIFEREGVMRALTVCPQLSSTACPPLSSTACPPLSSHEEIPENSCLVRHLKHLCSQLTKVDNVKTTSEGSGDNEDNTLISEILRDLSKGDGFSTFEFVESGVIDALLHYLSCGVYSKEEINESRMVIYRKKAMKRWESFVAVALSPGSQDTEVAPMKILLEKLQMSLSSLESFPVIMMFDARSSCGNVPLSSGLSSLQGKINLRLCKSEEEKSLSDYSQNVVSFHPLQKIADVEEFLWPLVEGDESKVRVDRHLGSPRLLFFQGGKELLSNLSIFEIVQRFMVDQIKTNKYNGESRIWDDTYEITYQSASCPTVSIETIGSTCPSKLKEVLCPVDSSKWQMSIMDSILCGKLPCDLEKSDSTYKILALLRLLEGLNKQFLHEHARAESSAGVPSKGFINEKLTFKLEEQITDAIALCSESLPSWCYHLTEACPFLFPFKTRRQYFYSTTLGHSRALYYLQEQQGVPERRDIKYGSLWTWRIRIPRDCALDRASKFLKVKPNLETVLEVTFDGEVDAELRSTIEFYAILSHDLQKVGLGMWRFDSASNKSVMEVDEKSRKDITMPAFDDLIKAPLGLFPRPWLTDLDVLEGVTFEKVLEYFELLGLILAKALQDKRPFHLPLSSAFYRLLLGQDLNLHDIVSFDAELGQKLLEWQSIAEKGETKNSGRDYILPDYPFQDKVDVNNLEEYVNYVVDVTVGKGIGRQLDALREGFSKVFDISSLQIFSPMELEDMLCQELSEEAYNLKMNKVHTRTSAEFNICQEHSPRSSSDRLKCHGREEFIDLLELLGSDLPVFCPSTKMIKFLDSKKENRGLDRHEKYTNEFMESSKFMVTADIPVDIKKLEAATDQLDELIDKDKDYYLCSNIVERLIQIFDYSDIQYTQFLAINILWSARYHDCSKVINEKAIPVLVKLINHPSSPVARRAVITLTRFALASSDHIPVIVDNGALEAAEKFVLNSKSGVYYVVHYLARLLAVVCRTNNLKPDKEKIAISISKSIFENKFYSSTTIHIKRACYALSYLSYGKHLEITDAVCDSLVKFLSHGDESVVASAFGVVGNIVRWGTVEQIQYLVGHCRLLECLGKSFLCSEHMKLRKGACQLISNVAVLSKTSIKDEAGLIESLCKVLEKDESADVKREAKWAINNCTYVL